MFGDGDAGTGLVMEMTTTTMDSVGEGHAPAPHGLFRLAGHVGSEAS
jgi:hypothetical protein